MNIHWLTQMKTHYNASRNWFSPLTRSERASGNHHQNVKIHKQVSANRPEPAESAPLPAHVIWPKRRRSGDVPQFVTSSNFLFLPPCIHKGLNLYLNSISFNGGKMPKPARDWSKGGHLTWLSTSSSSKWESIRIKNSLISWTANNLPGHIVAPDPKGM